MKKFGTRLSSLLRLFLRSLKKDAAKAICFSLSQLFISLILWRAKVGKNRKPAVFLITVHLIQVLSSKVFA